MAKKVFKFSYSSRGFDLESIFVAWDSELEWIMGKVIWFGEVGGKHSEVTLTMEEKYFTVVTDDPTKVQVIEEIIGSTGLNPFDYLEEGQMEELDDIEKA